MKAKFLTLAVAGTFSILSATAHAEEGFQGSWYVVPGISLLNADTDVKSDRTAPAGSLRIGKQLSEHFDVQVGGSYGRADSKDTYNGAALDGKYKQTLLGIDALYMFSREKLRPFLLAGFGYAHNDVDYTYNGAAVDGTKNSWMANLGAGVQYFFTDNVGIQADVRHVWSRAKGLASPTGFNDSGTIGNNYLNLGVVFNFGAPKKLAAAEPMQAGLADIAPTDDEAVGELMDPSQQAPEEPVFGPDKPAFAKINLQAEVLFDFDKYNLKDEGKKILDVEVVDKMKAHPEVELVLITGHTDRIGDDHYNQHLSERRAAAVKKYIASQGVAENRLHAVGKGEKEPVVDCKGVRGKKLISCLQPNRRVVVEIEVQRVLEK